jgi:hypothetical protein
MRLGRGGRHWGRHWGRLWRSAGDRGTTAPFRRDIAKLRPRVPRRRSRPPAPPRFSHRPGGTPPARSAPCALPFPQTRGPFSEPREFPPPPQFFTSRDTLRPEWRPPSRSSPVTRTSMPRSSTPCRCVRSRGLSWPRNPGRCRGVLSPFPPSRLPFSPSSPLLLAALRAQHVREDRGRVEHRKPDPERAVRAPQRRAAHAGLVGRRERARRGQPRRGGVQARLCRRRPGQGPGVHRREHALPGQWAG